MKGEIKTIKVKDIINYSANPRHEIGDNEKDTLKKLFEAVGIQYMLNLAEDIGEHGLLGNQQVVVVYFEAKKKYIVYEGNRRVAAIKLLLNPEKFDFLDKPSINKAKNIARKYKIEDDLECYVTDEEEAFFIMERVHSGEDKGRGTKGWGSREKETFKVRCNKSKDLAYLIDQYVREYCDGLDITTILPFTTIKRIFNNRKIKKIIGLDEKDETTFTSDRMKSVVYLSMHVKEDSKGTGIAVTRLYNTAGDIENRLIPWIKDHIKDNHLQAGENREVSIEKTDKEVKTQIKGINNSANDKTEGQKSSKGRNLTDRGTGGDENTPYFFQGLKFGDLDPNDQNAHGVAAVCNELKYFSEEKLVEECPIAAAFLTRAIIEQSLIYYSKRNKVNGQDKYISEDIKEINSFKNLKAIITKYKNNLPNYITDNEMRQYFNSLFDDYESNVDPLNWVIHRPSEYQLGSQELIDLPRKGLLALVNFMLSTHS